MAQAQVIDGKSLANAIVLELKNTISHAQKKRPPGLATVLVGDDKASSIYVGNKRKRAEEIGIRSFHHHLPHNSRQQEVLTLIDQLNNHPAVDAILVQLPLPKHIHEQTIIESIDANKDADGIHPENLGYLMLGDPRVVPCTPHGIMHLIKSTDFDLMGKTAVVVGRSNIVGKPMAHLFLQGNATVVMCHSHTKDLKDFTRQADVLVVAVGQANMINRDHIKKGAFVVDVGINRDRQNKLCGDVDFDDVRNVASFITPVPGGVGPLTIAMLLKNTFHNFLRTNP